ncbi:MAG: hypothetical protein NUV85_04080 [Candidatus Berkelbacteria bacterium]|nr:hypothetical protein [Candidatus Berkelbacteria bacterium]
MFWRKQEKPRVVSFKIANYAEEEERTHDAALRFEAALPPLGALPGRSDGPSDTFEAVMYKKDLTVQEIIDALEKRGLHATLIEEEDPVEK